MALTDLYGLVTPGCEFLFPGFISRHFSNFRVRFSTLPVVGRWLPTLENAGIPRCADPLSGEPFGAFITTSSINPTNWTRSEARNAYIDPLPPRGNLHILTNATVTRILFDSSDAANLTATGVEYAFVKGGPRSSVQVRKEVILSGGAIGSPHVLLHSGVGPSDLLGSVGIDLKLNLPGVGQHLQDHVVSFFVIRPFIEVRGSNSYFFTACWCSLENYGGDPGHLPTKWLRRRRPRRGILTIPFLCQLGYRLCQPLNDVRKHGIGQLPPEPDPWNG